MATKFHLTPEGPKPCTASTRPCKYGTHGTQEEMTAIFGNALQHKFGTTVTHTKVAKLATDNNVPKALEAWDGDFSSERLVLYQEVDGTYSFTQEVSNYLRDEDGNGETEWRTVKEFNMATRPDNALIEVVAANELDTPELFNRLDVSALTSEKLTPVESVGDIYEVDDEPDARLTMHKEGDAYTAKLEYKVERYNTRTQETEESWVMHRSVSGLKDIPKVLTPTDVESIINSELH